MQQKPSTFERLPLGAVQPAGWLRDQLLSDLEHGFAGCLDSLTERASHDLFSQRIESSADQMAWWDAETRGNWLWGYTMMAFLSGHAEHRARALDLLRQLQATQDADGYLGIYSPQARYQHGAGENGELWAQSRALLALLAAYEFTGDSSFLETVERAARLTMAQYGPGRSYFRAPEYPLALLVGVTHGLCYVDVMEWLYALTGQTDYRDFGVWLYDDFSSMPVPFVNDDLSARNLSVRERGLGGHAVHTAEHLRVLGWAAWVSGREDLHAALDSALHKLSRYTLPNGALIGDESIHGLPTPDIGYEYCTITEYLLSQVSLLHKFGQGADAIESLLFNAGQGARLADGSGLTYLTQDTRLDARADRPDSYSHFHGAHGRYKFSPTHEDVACCCNPNATRLLAHYIHAQWVRLTDQPGLAALLYGAGSVTAEIAGVAVRIDTLTDYPFDETLVYTITPAAPVTFRLSLRVPEWARGWRVTLNGVEIDAVVQGGRFIQLDRCWQPSDRVEVSFAAAVEIRPYVSGEYAVMRGPLQYVLPIEAVRQPLKRYGGHALHDFEAHPQAAQDSYRIPLLDGKHPNYGLVFERLSGPKNWNQPSLALTLGLYQLIPMGSACLRRAAFPVIELLRPSSR